jgi:hypothetical protein
MRIAIAMFVSGPIARMEQIIVPLDIAKRVHYTKAEYDRIVAGPETSMDEAVPAIAGPAVRERPRRTLVRMDALTTAIFLQPSIATKQGSLLRHRRDVRSQLRTLGRPPRVPAAVMRDPRAVPGRDAEGESSFRHQPRSVREPARRSDAEAPGTIPVSAFRRPGPIADMRYSYHDLSALIWSSRPTRFDY